MKTEQITIQTAWEEIMPCVTPCDTDTLADRQILSRAQLALHFLHEHAKKFSEFAELIARLKTEEDFGDDQPPFEDWICTLDNLIESARQLTGIEAPEREPVTDEERSNGPKRA